jgi:hypothetical protein
MYLLSTEVQGAISASHFGVIDLRRRGRDAMLSSGLISIIVSLIVIGLLLYLIDLIPMDGTIKQIIRIIVIIAVIVWLLQSFGLLGSLGIGHATRPLH